VYRKDQLLVSDKNKEALKRISDQFGVTCCSSNGELVRESSIVLLAVKPQNMREVLEEVKGETKGDHLMISIAAGIPLKMIRNILGRDIPLIRVMPNTPALVQKGVSALAGDHGVTPEHMTTAGRIFGAVGDTVEVEESMMDAVTALSGSGPGYVFRMMECMVEAGVAVGLEAHTSKRLIVQTFLGAAYLADESEHSLSRLREMVTSPGGTTAEGLAIFDKMGLKGMILKAVDAACKRAAELGKNY
jgi:pyrroline-5-carboxylate reductase